jgi:hypothetical protein
MGYSDVELTVGAAAGDGSGTTQRASRAEKKKIFNSKKSQF